MLWRSTVRRSTVVSRKVMQGKDAKVWSGTVGLTSVGLGLDARVRFGEDVEVR